MLTQLFTSIADAIRDIKGTTAKIKASDFPSEMATIKTRTDTSDATATAEDILLNETAYVDGEKITGTYKPLDTSDANATASDIASGKTAYVNGEKITGTASGGGSDDYFRRYLEKDWENNIIVLPEDLTEIQPFAFYDYGSKNDDNNSSTVFTKFYINNFPNNIKLIGNSVFSWYWEDARIDFSNITKLPDNLVRIGDKAFYKNTTLKINKFPDSLCVISTQAFSENTALTDIVMLGVQTLSGNISSYGSFYKCTNLKTVRIGSQLTSMGRYVFNGCTSLEAIYIDLPRATVETLAGYEYAFMNDATKTGIIICNDDENWVPYTE